MRLFRAEIGSMQILVEAAIDDKKILYIFGTFFL